MSQFFYTFIYERNKYSMIQDKDSIKKAIHEYIKILKRKEEDLYFICNGKRITSETKKTYKDLVKYPKTHVLIFVFNLNKIIKSDYKVENIICPKCQDLCMLDISINSISYTCKDNHKIYSSFNDYTEIKNINSNNDIKCELCNNNKKLYGFNFFLCSCRKGICPLCIRKHNKINKSHKCIFYDYKYFNCCEHSFNYISYCKKCKKNLCPKCEFEHLKHEIKLYKKKHQMKRNMKK